MKNHYFEIAQEFIETTDLNALPAGTHVIDEGNVWVNIVDADLKTIENAKLEVHDKYIDIQIPLSGPESFGVKKRCECTSPCGEMNKEKDILFFDDAIDNLVTVQCGEQIVFAPDTAHAPLIGTGRIHKAIFKVRA